MERDGSTRHHVVAWMHAVPQPRVRLVTGGLLVVAAVAAIADLPGLPVRLAWTGPCLRGRDRRVVLRFGRHHPAVAGAGARVVGVGYIASAMFMLGVASLIFLWFEVHDAGHLRSRTRRPRSSCCSCCRSWVSLRAEFREHFEPRDRREIGVDVGPDRGLAHRPAVRHLASGRRRHRRVGGRPRCSPPSPRRSSRRSERSRCGVPSLQHLFQFALFTAFAAATATLRLAVGTRHVRRHGGFHRHRPSCSARWRSPPSSRWDDHVRSAPCPATAQPMGTAGAHQYLGHLGLRRAHGGGSLRPGARHRRRAVHGHHRAAGAGRRGTHPVQPDLQHAGASRHDRSPSREGSGPRTRPTPPSTACGRPTRPCATPRSTCAWSSTPPSTASSSSTNDGVVLRANDAFCGMVGRRSHRDRGRAVDRARRRGRGRRSGVRLRCRRVARRRSTRNEGQPLYLESRVSRDPDRPAAQAGAGPRRHRRQGGRPDDPFAVPVPAGSRRGPHAPAATDQRRDRIRAQPGRPRPARRARARRVRRVALARGGAAHDQGGRGRPGHARSSRDPRGARRRGRRTPTADVGPSAAGAGGARADRRRCATRWRGSAPTTTCTTEFIGPVPSELPERPGDARVPRGAGSAHQRRASTRSPSSVIVTVEADGTQCGSRSRTTGAGSTPARAATTCGGPGGLGVHARTCRARQRHVHGSLIARPRHRGPGDAARRRLLTRPRREPVLHAGVLTARSHRPARPFLPSFRRRLFGRARVVVRWLGRLEGSGLSVGASVRAAAAASGLWHRHGGARVPVSSGYG